MCAHLRSLFAQGTFSVGGKTYHTPLNDHAYDTLHGGWIGYDRHVWKILEKSASSVTWSTVSSQAICRSIATACDYFTSNLSLLVISRSFLTDCLWAQTSPDGEEGFPGNMVINVTHSITEENEWTLDYSASTDAPTIIAMTNHAYFNLNANVDNTDTILVSPHAICRGLCFICS